MNIVGFPLWTHACDVELWDLETHGSQLLGRLGGDKTRWCMYTSALQTTRVPFAGIFSHCLGLKLEKSLSFEVVASDEM
jgi:hypothetical protein